MKLYPTRIPAWGQLAGWWILTALILWIRCEGIHMEGDPIVYAKLAVLKSQDLPPWQEWTFTSRTGILAPVSWIISFAGVSATSLLLWPVLTFFLLVTAIWLRRESFPTNGHLILLGILLLPWPSAYAIRLLPDAPMLAFATMALLSIPGKVCTGKEIIWRSFLIGTFLTVSLLCKLTVLYLIPVWWMMAWLIKKQRRNWRVHVGGFIVCGILLAALYLAESPFFDRLTQIDQDHNLSPFSYSWEEPKKMLDRLLIEPFQQFWANPGVAILIFPVLLGLIRPGKQTRWMTWGFLMLLVIHWVGSSSLTRYTPLPADPRMWILLTIPLISLSAVGIHWRLTTPSTVSARQITIWVMLLMLVGAGAAWMKNPGYHLALLIGLVLLPISWRSRQRVFLFGGLLVLWLGYQGWNRSSSYYQHTEQQLVQQHQSQDAVLLADTVLTFGQFLYSGKDGIIQSWPEKIPETENSLFLWNGTRVEQANLFSDRIQVPAYFSEIEQSWNLVASDSLFDIRLYQSPSHP